MYRFFFFNLQSKARPCGLPFSLQRRRRREEPSSLLLLLRWRWRQTSTTSTSTSTSITKRWPKTSLLLLIRRRWPARVINANPRRSTHGRPPKRPRWTRRCVGRRRRSTSRARNRPRWDRLSQQKLGVIAPDVGLVLEARVVLMPDDGLFCLVSEEVERLIEKIGRR